MDEAVGRSDKLCMTDALEYYKTKNLDFSKIFKRAEGTEVRYAGKREQLETFDEKALLPKLAAAVEKGKSAELKMKIHSVDRTAGAALSSAIVRRHGPSGLAPETIKVHFQGVAGQSFGAFLAPGVLFDLEGEANDFVGKGISGGVIVVRPPKESRFNPNENVIAGNVIGYGGTSGRMFFCGQAGERFAVRNSGFTAVVEGLGDHGCEYMTGGRVVVLGTTGVNFAAGMTGGIAYVYDELNDFDLRCNVDSVDLESILPGTGDEAELLELLDEHLVRTGSPFARRLLGDWENARSRFVKVIPFEYRLALERQRSHQE